MTRFNLTHLHKTPPSTSPSKTAASTRCDSEVRGRSPKLFYLCPVALLLALFLGVSPAHADFEAGAGAAVGGGFYQVDNTSADEFDFAVSPLVAAKWDPFDWKFRPTFGLATLPMFEYSMGHDAFTRPFIVAELGLSYGSPFHHAALVGQAGFFSFGAGLQYTWLPIKLSSRVRTGPEFRAMWLANKAGYLGLVWTFRFLQKPAAPHEGALTRSR